MNPKGTRNIKIDSTERSDRPRDAAIRAAENDNRLYNEQNDNEPYQNSSFPTVDQRFAATYQNQGLTRGVQIEYRQPSQIGKRVKRVGSATKVAGTSAVVAGKGLQLGGRALTRAGVALSSTGLGAVVGVPLAVIGGGATVAGTGAVAAGRTGKAYGRQIKTAGKKISAAEEKLNTRRPIGGKLGQIKAAATDPKKLVGLTLGRTFLYGALWVYAFLQLPVALMSLVFLGLTDALYSAASNLPGVVQTAGSALTSLLGTVSQTLLGFDITALLDPAGFFVVTWLLVLLIGWSTLFVGSFVFILQSSKPIFGQDGGSRKLLYFLAALILYTLPILNLLPWFVPWANAVRRYPK